MLSLYDLDGFESDQTQGCKLKHSFSVAGYFLTQSSCRTVTHTH